MQSEYVIAVGQNIFKYRFPTTRLQYISSNIVASHHFVHPYLSLPPWCSFIHLFFYHPSIASHSHHKSLILSPQGHWRHLPPQHPVIRKRVNKLDGSYIFIVPYCTMALLISHVYDHTLRRNICQR